MGSVLIIVETRKGSWSKLHKSRGAPSPPSFHLCRYVFNCIWRNAKHIFIFISMYDKVKFSVSEKSNPLIVAGRHVCQ